MFIEARLQTATRPAALVIPEDAVSPFAGAMYVWVIQDAKAQRREVVLGVRTPGYVEIQKGWSWANRWWWAAPTGSSPAPKSGPRWWTGIPRPVADRAAAGRDSVRDTTPPPSR